MAYEPLMLTKNVFGKLAQALLLPPLCFDHTVVFILCHRELSLPLAPLPHRWLHSVLDSFRFVKIKASEWFRHLGQEGRWRGSFLSCPAPDPGCDSQPLTMGIRHCLTLLNWFELEVETPGSSFCCSMWACECGFSEKCCPVSPHPPTLSVHECPCHQASIRPHDFKLFSGFVHSHPLLYSCLVCADFFFIFFSFPRLLY